MMLTHHVEIFIYCGETSIWKAMQTLMQKEIVVK